MSDHVFRNPDKIQQLPQRDWIRQVMPNGKEGFVVEDLDLILRWHGNKYKTDGKGKFALIELKHGNAKLGPSKKRTFGLIDECLRKGDPEGFRYMGYYLIQTETDCWEKCNSFVVNGVSLSQITFQKWLNMEIEINLPSYIFNE